MIDMNQIAGEYDLLFITLDTLRFDVAQRAYQACRIPVLSQLLPSSGWERRHSPANFTYAAHHAFFAGFLPTPAAPGPHPRLMAVDFPGSETITKHTLTFNSPNIVQGFEQLGYETICIGGVGFFAKTSPLGATLPGLFRQSYWSESMSVVCPQSTENQVALAVDLLNQLDSDQRVFLFVNISAIHQPNCGYMQGAREECPDTQQAALEYVDRSLPPLLESMRSRAPVFGIICSDHGTTYGENGYTGHRLNHPMVNDVPYTDFVLRQSRASHSAEA